MFKYVCCVLLASAAFSAPVDDKRDKRGLLASSLIAPAPLAVAHAPIVSHAPLLAPSISYAHAPLIAAPAVSSISSSSVHIQHPVTVAHAPLTVAHSPLIASSHLALASSPLIAHAPYTTLSHAPITSLGLAHSPLALSTALHL